MCLMVVNWYVWLCYVRQHAAMSNNDLVPMNSIAVKGSTFWGSRPSNVVSSSRNQVFVAQE